jgi:hypothetical protein
MRQVTRKGLMTVAAATGVLAAAGGYAHADSAANGSATNSAGVLSGNTVQAPVDVPVNVCGNTVDVVGVLNPAVGNACTNQSAGKDDAGGYGGGGSHGGSGAHGGSGGAHADGHTAHSPGVASGNHVQAPIHVPVNACGNTVDVVGLLNPTTGNDCANQSAGGGYGGEGSHGGSGAHAGGHTADSPGVASGNHVEAPIHVPVNVCGNSVDVVGLLNPTTGNDCANGSDPGYGTPPGHDQETPGNQGPGTPADSGKPSPSGSEGAPSTPERVTPAGHASAYQPAHSAQLAHTGSELPLGLALPAGAGALLAGAVLYRKARASA